MPTIEFLDQYRSVDCYAWRPAGHSTVAMIRYDGMTRPIDASRIELLDPAIVKILKSKTPAERLAMV